MRLIAACAALLAASMLGGCLFGAADGPRLAEPTDKISPPIPTPPTRTPPPNYRDPGYEMNESWHVGDQWDYVSEKGDARTLKVVSDANLSGEHAWRLLESFTTGTSTTRAYSWILDKNYTRMSLSADSGISQSFSPYAPQRIVKNASYEYNLTSTQPPAPPVSHIVSVKTRYTGQSIRTLPWGNVLAARVEEIDKTGTSTSTTIHWVSREYANDVFFELNGEEFKLVASHVGDRFHGDLRIV